MLIYLLILCVRVCVYCSAFITESVERNYWKLGEREMGIDIKKRFPAVYSPGFMVSTPCKWEGGAPLNLQMSTRWSNSLLPHFVFFAFVSSPPFFWPFHLPFFSLSVFPSQLISVLLNSANVNILHIEMQSRDAILALISPPPLVSVEVFVQMCRN